MKNKITLYTVTHKEFDSTDLDKNIYKIIKVGTNKNDLSYLRDDSGDNISDKNKNYCELTALYWIWKNDKESNIVGITHYRRYFYKYNVFTNKKHLLNKKEIKKYLNKADIIVPKMRVFRKETVKEQYNRVHRLRDLIMCREIIREKYPDYIKSFDKVIDNHYLYSYNMLITFKTIYNQYMEWLFDILFELENRIDISDYDEYQSRIYGFLSERLFNVWLEKNSDLKCKEILVIVMN